ncbi:hypothetical protein [Zavarzinia sp. CC-PAN008]|uniref:hypothetical protein n=1 Tax=Zavarzinia sp. CC-PAN008 TaxID=3243332 RepID=UPI003F7477D4
MTIEAVQNQPVPTDALSEDVREEWQPPRVSRIGLGNAANGLADGPDGSFGVS